MRLKIGERGIIVERVGPTGWEIGDRIRRISKKEFEEKSGSEHLEEGYFAVIQENAQTHMTVFEIANEYAKNIMKITKRMPQSKIESLILLKTI